MSKVFIDEGKIEILQSIAHWADEFVGEFILPGASSFSAVRELRRREGRLAESYAEVMPLKERIRKQREDALERLQREKECHQEILDRAARTLLLDRAWLNLRSTHDLGLSEEDVPTIWGCMFVESGPWEMVPIWIGAQSSLIEEQEQ